MEDTIQCIPISNPNPAEPIVYIPCNKVCRDDRRHYKRVYDLADHRPYVCLAHPSVSYSTKNILPIGCRSIFPTSSSSSYWFKYDELPDFIWISRFGCKPTLVARRDLSKEEFRSVDLDCPCAADMLVPCESREDALTYALNSPLPIVREWAKSLMVIPECDPRGIGEQCLRYGGQLCRNCLHRYC